MPQTRFQVGPGIYLAKASEETASVQAARAPEPGQPAPVRAPAAGRIVGGTKTTSARWPWQAEIRAYGNHNCGGSLVAPDIVVSAAHCFNLGGKIWRPPDEFQIVTGRTRLSGKGGQEHEVADYYFFVDEDGKPLWNRKTIVWDVVFAELGSDAKQEPIKIAGPGESAVWTPGHRAIVTGWGTTVAGTDAQTSDRSSNVLRRGTIKMISDAHCDSVYGPAFVPDVMVCAGLAAGGVDVCQGDSGGPLVVPIAGGDYRLVGDTSFAEGCALPDTPGVYGRLAADPIRGALKRGIMHVAGVNAVGYGGLPANRFSFGRRAKDERRGRATLTVRVPGRGQVLLGRTSELRADELIAKAAGNVRLRVRPRGEAKRKLAGAAPGTKARLRVRMPVTYSPLGGEPRKKIKRMTLVKRG